MERLSLESKEWSWAKTIKLQFWKYNINRNWDNVFFTNESSFYLKILTSVDGSQIIITYYKTNKEKNHVWGVF